MGVSRYFLGLAQACRLYMCQFLFVCIQVGSEEDVPVSNSVLLHDDSPDRHAHLSKDFLRRREESEQNGEAC